MYAESHIEEPDAPLFLRFINLLVNDATFLLDEALSVSLQQLLRLLLLLLLFFFLLLFLSLCFCENKANSKSSITQLYMQKNISVKCTLQSGWWCLYLTMINNSISI